MPQRKKYSWISETRHIDFTPSNRDRDALSFFEKKLAAKAGHYNIALIPHAEVIRYCILECFRHLNHGRGRTEYHRTIIDYMAGAYANEHISFSTLAKYNHPRMKPAQKRRIDRFLKSL